MSDMTIRCTCGLYFRFTDAYSNQLLMIAQDYFRNHECGVEDTNHE